MKIDPARLAKIHDDVVVKIMSGVIVAILTLIATALLWLMKTYLHSFWAMTSLGAVVGAVLGIIVWFIAARGLLAKQAEPAARAPAPIESPPPPRPVDGTNMSTKGDDSPIFTARDISAPVVIGNSGTVQIGVSEETTKELLAILKKEKAVLEKEKPEFQKLFPAGYAVFGVTGARQIVSFDNQLTHNLSIDWSKSTIAPNGDLLGVHLMNVRSDQLKIDHLHVDVRLKEGAKWEVLIGKTVEGKLHISGDAIVTTKPKAFVSMTFGDPPYLILTVQILKTADQYDVLVVGVSPAPSVFNFRKPWNPNL